MPASISLLYFLIGKVLHVFPLDLNQVSTLCNPLLGLTPALILIWRAEQDCRLLGKLQAVLLVLLEVGLEPLILRIWLRLCWRRERYHRRLFLFRLVLLWMHGIPAHDSERSSSEQHYCDHR